MPRIILFVHVGLTGSQYKFASNHVPTNLAFATANISTTNSLATILTFCRVCCFSLYFYRLKADFFKQKINKEAQTLKDTMDQLDLIDIYRTFHPKTINFTFFSSAHGTFSRIDHILGHESSLGKFKKIEIIPVIFSDHRQ